MTDIQKVYKSLLPCPFCGGVAIVVPAAAIGVWRAGCAGRMPKRLLKVSDNRMNRWRCTMTMTESECFDTRTEADMEGGEI